MKLIKIEMTIPELLVVFALIFANAAVIVYTVAVLAGVQPVIVMGSKIIGIEI